jgi:hypothetical protein
VQKSVVVNGKLVLVWPPGCLASCRGITREASDEPVC